MCGGLGHTPGGAGRTNAMPFTGIRNQEVVAAAGAACPAKAGGKNATFEIAAKLPRDDAGNRATGAVIV